MRQHVESLSSKYEIEVKENTEIYIIFIGYKIPSNIWNRETTDLLIITHSTYPNAKIDMFWVDPPLELKNGGKSKAANVFENKLGRSWQRFSWHLQTWNPGKDNLITYLEDVNRRLRKKDKD